MELSRLKVNNHSDGDTATATSSFDTGFMKREWSAQCCLKRELSMKTAHLRQFSLTIS